MVSEPVTMAVAAAVGESSSRVSSRWTALSVALEPDDAAISLEQEMQRAYAAFAAAESGHISSPAEFETASAPAVAEAPVQVPATVAPEAAQTLTAVASAATEAVTAAVEQLEKVANSFGSQNSDSAGGSAEPQSTVMAAGEITNFESPSVAGSASANQASESDSTRVPEASLPDFPHPVSTATQQESPKTDSASEEFAAAGVSAATESEAPKAQESVISSERAIAESTAAMAAAVGGRSVEETSSDPDPAIASIVDSVLANLRPKIVEEISRKLGKK